MHIISIRHGRFPQIRMLNHRFRENARHLMVTLDVEGYSPPVTRDFFSIYHSLTRVFPTLAQHQCCEQWENTPLFLQETDGVSIKTVGEVADIAHLAEHVIVDLVVAVSSTRTCSGVTCGHRQPENRFDLFIECEDVRLGVFAANFAVHLIRRLFAKARISGRYAKVVEAARFFHGQPNGRNPQQTIISRLGYPPGLARMAANHLRVFGFFEDYDHEHN
jgi:hypothetical protein